MNASKEQLQILMNSIEIHKNSTITIPMTTGRTNQFFKCKRDLLEIIIHPKTHVVDFDPISEKDLVRRFNINSKGEMELFEQLMITIEQYRRLPKSLTTTSLKDVMKDGSEVVVNCNEGTVTRILGAKTGGTVDHEYWEKSMREIFVYDEAYEAMRKHLMLFAFTNYEELPQFIFTGERGIGKNVYTEMLQSIFVAGSISLDEDIIESQYNGWMKNVLVIADEAMPKTLKTYKLLKSLGNHSYKSINEKYMLAEQYRTNATVIITSNDDIPIYTKATELATSSKNNQFYVYASPVKSLTKFDTKMTEKIKACTVAYVREVLAKEWETFQNSAEYNECRYHMDVPISQAQKELFESNETEAELFIDDLEIQLLNDINMPLPSTYIHLQDDGSYFISADALLNQYCTDAKIDKIKLAKILGKSKKFKKTSKRINNKVYRGYVYNV